MFSRIYNKIKENKKEFIIFILILTAACFLRFYNLNTLLHFANDEARDAFIAKDFIENLKLPLLGPEVSMGHFHLGPIFYYFLIPFYLLFQKAPVAGAFLSALSGIASVFMIWKLTKAMFSGEAALITSLLYSTSFIVVLHSRWSWNPNLVPFFLLLYIYAFFKIINNKEKTRGWFYVFVLSLGILLQLHASMFLLIPITIVIFLIFRPKNLSWHTYLIGILIILILFTPLIYFEASNNFENLRKIIEVILYDKSNVTFIDKIIFNFEGIISLVSALVFSSFINLENTHAFSESYNFLNIYTILSFVLFLLIVIISLYKIFKNKIHNSNFIYIFIILLFFVFIISKKVLFLHYFIIFFPLVFIFLGYFIYKLYKYNIYGKMLTSIIIVFITFLNISYLANFWISQNNGSWQKNHKITLWQLEAGVDYIVKEAKNDKIHLVCEVDDYCQSFKYLLDLKNIKIDSYSSNRFRIYQSYNIESDFKPIQISH